MTISQIAQTQQFEYFAVIYSLTGIGMVLYILFTYGTERYKIHLDMLVMFRENAMRRGEIPEVNSTRGATSQLNEEQPKLAAHRRSRSRVSSAKWRHQARYKEVRTLLN